MPDRVIDLAAARATIDLATAEGYWYTVGNTVYIHDKETHASFPRQWLAFPGDIPRAAAIAALPALAVSLVEEVERLREAVARADADARRECAQIVRDGIGERCWFGGRCNGEDIAAVIEATIGLPGPTKD